MSAKLDKFDRALIKKDDEIEVLWARVCDLRQLLNNYAAEHDRGESSGTGKRVKCGCIHCQKVQQANNWQLIGEPELAGTPTKED